MQTFGIVALSILAGIFICILLAGIATTIVIGLRVKSAALRLESEIVSLHAWSENGLAEQMKAITALLESAKSNFSSIRNEMRGSQEATLAETRATLEAHRAEMDKAIQAINGVRLLEASKRVTFASISLQRIAAKLEPLLTDQPEVEPEDGKAWPAERAEEYAPNGETIYSSYPTGQMDVEAAQEELSGTE